MEVDVTKLPVGLQSFRTIREDGFRYVDKTGFAARLIRDGRRYFLSRPRRFGKSLFVDTLKELFEGNEELFRGLAIHGNWDWNVRYPVIHLSLGKGNFSKKGELKQRISEMLGSMESAEDLPAKATTLSGRFGDLIQGLHQIFGQPVVVLVDEYDKSILDATRNSKIMQSNRQTLQGFYSTIKDEDAYIRFCFVTGVSRFAHVSLFSATNNLDDITFVPAYSSICGYTESDLDRVFAEEIVGLDREKIRDWYNGYCWLGEEKVYNSYGMLLLLRHRTFRSRWYETGTPAYLFEIMERRGILPAELKNAVVSSKDLAAPDLERISVGSMLLQAGYMSIIDEKSVGERTYYRLDFPNREVRQAFYESLLFKLLPQDSTILTSRTIEFEEILEAGEVDRIESTLHAMFSGIPHQWHAKPGPENFESYFASVVYVYFLGSGIDVRVEDSTSEGRIDLAAITSAHIYLFEFKVVNKRPSGKSIKQLKAKNYADKYRQPGLPIHLVAVEFSKKTRNIVWFKSELA